MREMLFSADCGLKEVERRLAIEINLCCLNCSRSLCHFVRRITNKVMGEYTTVSSTVISVRSFNIITFKSTAEKERVLKKRASSSKGECFSKG